MMRSLETAPQRRLGIFLLVVTLATAFCGDPIATPPETQEGVKHEQTQASGGPSIDKKIESIDAVARRLEGIEEAPASQYRRLEWEAPKWQFLGLLENDNPIFLVATLMEGHVVREEKHYLDSGKLVLVKSEQWWDVDEPRRAPEPPTRQDFYIDGGRVIRAILAVDSEPPSKRIDDAGRDAAALIERSARIARILSEKTRDTSLLDSLRSFP